MVNISLGALIRQCPVVDFLGVHAFFFPPTHHGLYLEDTPKTAAKGLCAPFATPVFEEVNSVVPFKGWGLDLRRSRVLDSASGPGRGLQGQ